MSAVLVSLILSLSANWVNPSLLEVRLDNRSLPVLRQGDFKPLAVMQNSVIIEALPQGPDRLTAAGIDYHVLLAAEALNQARANQLLYLVTPPAGAKNQAQAGYLATSGQVLAEDEYSYLLLTSQGFAEALPPHKYEIARVAWDGIVLPERLGRTKSQAPLAGRLAYNSVIDTIIHRITPTELAQFIREFSGERRVTVRGQPDSIITRYTSAPKNSSAIWYLYEHYQTYGLDSVNFHAYSADSNVIATKNGTTYPTKYWIIGGHLDNTSEMPLTYAPGADDNATGTIMALIAAKYLAPYRFKYTIKFMGWNGEEQGLLGSDAHARLARSRGDSIKGAFTGDMIGTEFSNLDSVQVYNCNVPGAIAMGDTFRRCAGDYNLGLHPSIHYSVSANSDYYSYYNQGYNSIMAIEKDFSRVYHTTQDRIIHPDFDTVFYCKVVQCMVASLATLAELDLTNDVGVTRIVAPAGTIDSGVPITPACSVYNYGTATQSYPVRMKIGGFYNNTVQVTGHPGLTRLYVTFPAYSAWPRGGPYPVTCSTELTGDMTPGNDKKTGVVTVAVHDVGVTVIVAPVGVVDSGASSALACSVYNFGSVAETYPVRVKIGSFYNNAPTVTSHAPATCLGVALSPFTFIQRGRHVVSCSTELGTDVNHANDRKICTLFVRVQDVGVSAITAPVGTVDSGSAEVPRASIQNPGNVDALFDIAFSIDDGYANTISRTVAAGAESTFAFPTWTPLIRGSHLVKCSTQLAGDMVAANNLRTGTVNVVVHDVGVLAILAPSGSISPGLVSPLALVRNNGTDQEAVALTFKINSSPPYSRTLTIGDGLPTGADTTVTFPSWTAVAGAYVARCSVYSEFDQAPANDTLSQGFTVSSADIGVTAILRPTGSVTPGYVRPQARVKNFGDVVVAGLLVTFDVRDATVFAAKTGGVPIFLVYSDTQTVASLAPGAETDVNFESLLVAVGSYATKARSLFSDANPANDSLLGSFTVASGPSGWVQKADAPLCARSKKVKDGGCLTCFDSSNPSDTSYIYAFKGGNTCEFYAYNIESNTWASKESIPAIGRSNRKKGAKKGSALCYDKWHDKIYATKGGNTFDFWQYDVATGVWAQKPDAPIGGGKGVKDGAGLALFHSSNPSDTSYVYLLKGSNTTEFYAYDVATEIWTSKTNAPIGASGKKFKDGSCVVPAADGIYALKGSYNELFYYNPDDSAWATKSTLPVIGQSGKKRKAKSGAGMAENDRTIYALKGGNTTEFWGYLCDTDRWVQLADMPLGGGKRVKGGGGLTCSHSSNPSHTSYIFAFKGNNTTEFWRYGPSSYSSQFTASRPNQMSNFQLSIFNLQLAAKPNPFSNATTITYSLPTSGNVSLKLYDVTGALVSTLVSGYHPAGTSSFIVPRSSLSSGIYLLKFDAGITAMTAKLIIE
jgi:hypothetical protein